MRDYLTIDLAGKTVERETWTGEQLARAGRYYIAKTMVERGLAKIDPFSPENPLIFSVGPFAGSNMSNANRISIGCKSPLTGGIKEANAGGTFGFALGQAELCGLTLENASDDWTVIYITKEGDVSFHDASPYMGKGVIESAALLHDEFGEKVSLAICGPVGEYQGLMAGISMSDPEGRPVRIAARGGVGAVMGAKKVKALVCDKNKMPTYHDRRGVMKAVKEYGAKLKEDAAVQNLGAKGTALVADVMNSMGGCRFAISRAGSWSTAPKNVCGWVAISFANKTWNVAAPNTCLYAGVHDQMLQHLCGQRRQRNGLAFGIRNHRPVGHELWPRRSGPRCQTEHDRQ